MPGWPVALNEVQARSMWTISATADLPSLRGGGGQPFTDFVDGLLRTHCVAIGVPDASIATTLRVNVGDGGVDTRIDSGSPADGTGRLRCPTAWQYKAEPASKVTETSVVREIEKKYAAELLAAGYAYRVCVCDEFTAEKKGNLERALNSAANQISNTAQPCLVLSSSDITQWANRYPGLVASRFNRPVTVARHWNSWQRTERSVTPAYVLPADWQMPGAAELVVVTNDDRRAHDAALWLVNSGNLSAILVADECSASGRFELSALVRGHEARIRVIAIDNTGEPPQYGAPGIWLEKVGREIAEKILGANFNAVPDERRRAYAEMSGGYIRLAADLCWYDPQMNQIGGLGPALQSVEDYYRKRIDPSDLAIVEAIALVHRVGYADDVAEQLERLSELTGIEPKAATETAQRLKDAPGFVAVTPRYLYVTPQIIAEIAFQRGWKRWAFPQPSEFLDRIPEQLRPAFETRVRSLSNPEVRSIVSAHFRQRVTALTPADLADYSRVEQLLGLLDTDPSTFLPQLARLIAEASVEQLAAVNGDHNGPKGTRRGFVWAAERLVSFPEYFSDAELILRRLALVETEPGIGNNATGIWRQLFRVYLSGTAVPFLPRFEIFKRLALSIDPNERDLALGGLDHIIDTHVTRMGGPSLIAGRIPPADWQPQTAEDWSACVSSVMDFAERLLGEPEPLAQAGWRYFKTHLGTFLAWQQLERLQGMVKLNPIPPDLLGPWLEEIDDYLQYECADHTTSPPEYQKYCDQVVGWRNELLPADFSDRLRAIVGKDLWHHSIREDIWNEESEIAPLVIAVVSHPELLEANLNFLLSPEASSAAPFGLLLGRQDPDAQHLGSVIGGARRTRSSALLRGYISGLLQAAPQQAIRINELLDHLEHEDPQIAAEIVACTIDVTDAVSRFSRMISAGQLNAGYVQYLHYGGAIRKATSANVAWLLRALVAPESSPERLKFAVELIGDRLGSPVSVGAEEPETLTVMKDILVRSAAVDDGAEYWWHKSLAALAPLEPEWTASAAAAAVSGEDFGKRGKGTGILSSVAAKHPDIIMNIVGAALLNPKEAWRWSIGSNRSVIEALPPAVILQWLDRVGIEGARGIARHLPSPFLSPDGRGGVPEVTARVLERYGEDEAVFRAFAAGRHDLEASSGPVSSYYEGRIAIAQAFLNHPLAVIRRWAELEIASAEHFAEIWRKQEEDESFQH
jgi:hypothetical protein